jgi:hypothetical protein
MTGSNGFHHTYETPADAEAREKAAEMAQLLKELEQWQGVIATNLGIMIRSGATPNNVKQLQEASAEYGERLSAIMDYAGTARLAAPAKNRY